MSIDPMPYREVLADATTSDLSALSKTTAQATADAKSVEFYRKFKVVIQYLEKAMIITDKLASVGALPSVASWNHAFLNLRSFNSLA